MGSRNIHKILSVIIFLILLVGCGDEEVFSHQDHAAITQEPELELKSIEASEWQVGPSTLEITDRFGDYIGLDIYEDVIYLRRTGEEGSRTLYKSTDYLETIEPIHTFDETVSHMFKTPFGMFVQSGGFIHRSTDSENWEKVFELPTSTILQNGWDFDPINEVVYFGEYHKKGENRVNIHRGLNGGEDWEVAYSFNLEKFAIFMQSNMIHSVITFGLERVIVIRKVEFTTLKISSIL
ncbi:hypothetical protein ACLIA0_10120 [Bacillaceae bacterium W0354]